MRLTVLGSAASYAGPGQACAGHLVRTDGASIMLDCGNGSLANLAHILDPLSLDAVFVTHEHVDHFADVYALQAQLRYAPQGPAGPLPLYAPSGLGERMVCLLSEAGRAEFAEAFHMHELVDGEPITVGDAVVTPWRVDHTPATYALAVEAGGARLCYTSDTAPGPLVERAAAGSDLLLAEATLPQQYAGRAPHLTAAEAAGIAARAGARSLVLVHVWPTNDREAMLGEARAVFSGDVRVASEYDEFDI